MPTWIWVVIAVAAVLVVAAVVFAALRTRRTRTLRQRFGPEYEHTVESYGDRREAEGDLRERTKRREHLDIRPLTQAARERYGKQWRVTQARFVDAPETAVREADMLVQSVMQERGYPVDDFEQRAADVSVDHPHVVDNYRAAHTISLVNDEGNATTEDLRQALVHYRALFEELLVADGSDEPVTRERDAAPERRQTNERV